MTDAVAGETTTTPKVIKIKLKGGVGEVEVNSEMIVDMDVYEYIFTVGLETIIMLIAA